MKENIYLINDDVFDVMEELLNDPGLKAFDAVIADPPYASGGLTSQERSRPARTKYQNGSSKKEYPDFHNDNRDMRTHFLWSVEWMKRAYALTRYGGFLMVFSDWRQNALTTDALQVAGWAYRGMVVWDKTEQARPQKGLFRNQCEYIHIATKGSLPPIPERPDIYPSGVFREKVNIPEKVHLTEKPVSLMEYLISILPSGSKIFDPFSGSGPLLVAANNKGHCAVGVEILHEYYTIARERLDALTKLENES